MSCDKRKILLKAFVKSQFNKTQFCPLTWMFYDRKTNSIKNHIHKRAVYIVYKNNALSFEELQELEKSFKIHHRNIQSFAIELNIKYNLSVTTMDNIF